jgi:N-acetylgalactosamine-6-sulfatase
MLKDSGYSTAIAGKWHLGYEDKFAPRQHGFEHAFYAIGGGMDYFHHVEDPPGYRPALYLDGKPVKRDGYITDLIADDALRWLRGQAESRARRPFFLYVPFTSPHAPYQGPKDSTPSPLPPDSDRWKQGKADPVVYAAMIERMDQSIGRILDAMDEYKLASNTIVAFASDNGGTASARPTGLRGFKGSTFEGGIRVPCIVRWPGVLKGGYEYRHPAVTFDLTASMARAAGVAPPKTRPFDGVDVLRFVAANEPPPPRVLFWRQRRGERSWRGVRDNSLKYVLATTGSVTEEYLFDLDSDPGEKSNLIGARAADAERLRMRLAAWEREVRPLR